MSHRSISWLRTSTCVLLKRSPSVIPAAILVVLIACGGCRPDEPPKAPAAAPTTEEAGPSRELPRLEWSEPEPDDPNVVEVSGGGWPASLASLRRRFTEKPWQEARKPWFRIWLTDDDFFQITIDPSSSTMVGTARSVRIMEDGPLRGEKLPVTRTTGPLADEGAALMLLEAYLKQDGSFDQHVQWAD